MFAWKSQWLVPVLATLFAVSIAFVPVPRRLLEHGPCRHPLASLMASAMVLDDMALVECAAGCGHRIYSGRGPLECVCHWPPGSCYASQRKLGRIDDSRPCATVERPDSLGQLLCRER